ncbi:MAG TPA: superoxide dismutase family protein [Longimicrobiaceae bacterium]
MRFAKVLACCCLAAAACGREKPGETAAAPAIDSAVAGITGDSVRDTTHAVGDTTMSATAEVRNAAGRALGTVTLAGAPDGIAVSGQITGLPPGEHGFHLHAVGRCDPPGFDSAGPHWNPANKQHGTLNPAGPHAGDLGNLNVSPDGVVNVAGTTRGGSLRELLDADGAALVVHEKADDYRTDPSGNSGARIACGVIQRAP